MKTIMRPGSTLIICALLASGFTAYSQKKTKPVKTAVPVTAMARNPKVAFKDLKLKNGLRVLLAEDHSAPVVSITVTYNVGSRNERPGRTGFAHLFEHMMFQGSENVGKSEHFILVSNNGGFMNGTTSQDRTNYFEVLPANQLDLALFLEADRMRSLVISRENLDNQRNAVQEERRLGLDNQPYATAFEKFNEMMYDNFGYKHSTIGSMDDLNAASVEDVKEFFRIYYAPNNAVLALAGDFNSAEALAKIKKHYESIPSQPAPPAVDMTEPEQTAERRMTESDALAQLPLVAMAHKGIIGNTPDYYAMQMLNLALASGQSSRLYQRLVKEKQLAIQTQGFIAEHRGPGYHQIIAIPAPGKKPEDVEAALKEELDRIQQEPITDAELEKARNFMRRQAIQSVQSSGGFGGIATLLSQYAVFYNDPNLINTRFEKIAAVTKADVQRVAQKYLRQTNRCVLYVLPRPKGAGATASGR